MTVGGPEPRDGVCVLGAKDASAAAELIALAFAEEPGVVALFPDVRTRAQLKEVNARGAVRRMLPHGTVHGAFVGETLAAVALWHPPGVPVTSIVGTVRGVADLLPYARRVARAVPHAARTILGESREAVTLQRRRSRAIAAASDGATWHLAILATSLQHRGRGLARRLLERQLARCDEDGLAAWLETTDPVNPPIYERFGFTTVAHVQDAAWLPGYWVMRREPHSDETPSSTGHEVRDELHPPA